MTGIAAKTISLMAEIAVKKYIFNDRKCCKKTVSLTTGIAAKSISLNDRNCCKNYIFNSRNCCEKIYLQ